MKKRTFLKTTGAIIAGSVLSPLTFCTNPEEKMEEKAVEAIRKNWAGNLEYHAKLFHEPANIETVQAIIKESQKIRALGSKHCFNHIADSNFAQISSRSFNKLISIDSAKMTATIGAGAKYGEVVEELHNQGYAIHNLASLPHITIGGAIATSTHGSGIKLGNLGAPVIGMKFVNGKGEIVNLSVEDDAETLNGVITHLGAFGLITELTLKIEPAFDVRQDIYLSLPVANLLENFNEIMGAGYSVSLFTDYQTDTVNQVWIKSRMDQGGFESGSEFYGAIPADRNVHPIIEISAENCTEQMGNPGPWYDRLPHFKMNFTPSNGVELQAEYFVPLEHGAEAYQEISKLKDLIKPYLMISEIRTIAANEQWMSPFYKQDSVAFHFTLEQDWEGVKGILPEIEKALTPFNVKPHWGKMFTLEPSVLQSRYANLNKFKEFVAEHDPEGKFRNEFMEKYLYS
ncbi:MAG: FAD-binding protein [Bacteroidetes bacterium]|nr:FAD-binding protein [Bacteroidota bacterium]MCB0844576.1 FAD-binding protein [Bacteroidota bacterium]